jgi:hypothetical protein
MQDATEFLIPLSNVVKHAIDDNPQSQHVRDMIMSMLTLSRIPHEQLLKQCLLAHENLTTDLKLINILVVQQLTESAQSIHLDHFYDLIFNDLENEMKEQDRLELKQRLGRKNLVINLTFVVCHVLAKYINQGSEAAQNLLTKLHSLDTLPAIYISSLVTNPEFHDQIFSIAITKLPQWNREAFQTACEELFPKLLSNLQVWSVSMFLTTC